MTSTSDTTLTPPTLSHEELLDQHTEEETTAEDDIKWYDKEHYAKRKQTAKAINAIIMEHKRLIGTYKSIAPIREPVMFLIMRGGSVQYYDNVKEATFIVPTDSKGETKKIHLNERKLLTFKYGKHSFKGYICHEDSAFPLPAQKTVDSALLESIVHKMYINYERLKASLERARWSGMAKLIGAIALVIVAYALYRVLVPQGTGGEQVVADAVQNGAEVAREVTTLGG